MDGRIEDTHTSTGAIARVVSGAGVTVITGSASCRGGVEEALPVTAAVDGAHVAVITVGVHPTLGLDAGA